jgi:farnesyl diphosphate synthase
MTPLLTSFFQSSQDAIQPILQHYLANPHAPRPLMEAMTQSIQHGGKRLRPTLALACADLFHVPRISAAHVGAAIEMVHGYSLIHDDLPAMDNADMRRGHLSCWRQFGEATAILAGDSLLPLAFEILGDEKTHHSPAVRLSLIQALAKDCGASGMAGGQLLDLSPHLIDSLETATTMQSLKTGCLFAFSCESGAILGQAPLEDRQRLRHFGFLFGLAFQIQDDLLDREGTVEELGKPIGMDDHKRSLVAFLGNRESKRYLASLHQEMIQLMKPYHEPFFEEIILWAIRRKN